MRRIGLAVVLTVSLFAAMLGVEAQEAKVPRIGVLIPGVADEESDDLLALRGGLRRATARWSAICRRSRTICSRTLGMPCVTGRARSPRT
jgi:hypothetical protein